MHWLEKVLEVRVACVHAHL